MSAKKTKRPQLAPHSADLQNGEPWWVKEQGYITCCDCGLRHHMTISKEVKKRGRYEGVKINDTWLLLQIYRDDQGTSVIRNDRGIVGIRKVKKRKKT